MIQGTEFKVPEVYYEFGVSLRIAGSRDTMPVVVLGFTVIFVLSLFAFGKRRPGWMGSNEFVGHGGVSPLAIRGRPSLFRRVDSLP